MPYTTKINIGVPFLMTIGVVYALPTPRCLMFNDTAAATFQQAANLAGPWITLVPDVNEQIEVGGGFIQCAGSNVTIMLSN